MKKIKPNLKYEPLNKVIEGNKITKDEIIKITTENKYIDLFKAAQYIRIKYKKTRVTFSKKVFFNIINLCRDTCSYCTFKAKPNEQKLSMMDKNNILQLVNLAKKYRCTEALLVTGEKPEQKYVEAKTWLKKQGFKNTEEYLVYISELILNKGLFPHTNAGNIDKEYMKDLKKTNASIGLMLENNSNRLLDVGMPHHLSPSKRPLLRLQSLENAGRLKIPTTTGILIGIGETMQEIINSLYTIKNMHQRFGHIQEVILQNFKPKLNTKMEDCKSPTESYFKIIIALTRIIMPNMNIQIPPNLSLNNYHSFLHVGINDWGGISPLTPDYVNPECPWPKIHDIEKNTKNAGFKLMGRFPVYPEFIHLVDTNIKDKMSNIKNNEWLVESRYWK